MKECLCLSDPYCPNCGDPIQAKIEEALDQIYNLIINKNMSEQEIDIFIKTGLNAIKEFRSLTEESQKIALKFI